MEARLPEIARNGMKLGFSGFVSIRREINRNKQKAAKKKKIHIADTLCDSTADLDIIIRFTTISDS
jgi:hypothetical protein